jgi:hypothetical protein
MFMLISFQKIAFFRHMYVYHWLQGSCAVMRKQAIPKRHPAHANFRKSKEQEQAFALWLSEQSL